MGKTKSESTILMFGGMPTPESMNTVTPKPEPSPNVTLDGSNDPQDKMSRPGVAHDSLATYIPEQERQQAHEQRRSFKEQGGLEAVGHDLKGLVDTIEEMRRVGLQSIAPYVPQLVLVGDQSAGKSSLMSAIAEINLPRGGSTCTRCPTNIKTAYSQNWSCKVLLQESYSYTPILKKKAEFPYWELRTNGMLTKPFKTVTEKTELENVLRWAQISLLNPSEDINTFVPGAVGHDEQVRKREKGHKELATFSPNVIAIEITGPRLPALSFYDLPGLIHNPDVDDEAYLVQVFKNMALKYIQHPKSLIICAITMSNDPGNSQTMGVIRGCKVPQGTVKPINRCIGVLTMPDLLQGDKFDDYDDIFHGKKFVLSLGYFATKQPSKHSPIMLGSEYHENARKEEDEFFASQSHWAEGGSWTSFRNRCGTSTIQKHLSKEFVKSILESLPKIEHEIHQQAREVDKKLASMPEIASDQVQLAVRQSLNTFNTEVGRLFDGTRNRSLVPFHSEFKRLCHQFKQALKVMRPGCGIGHESDKIVTDIITINDSSDDASIQTPVGKKRPFRAFGESASKKSRLNDTPISFKLERPTPRQQSARPPLEASAPVEIYKKLRKEDYGPFFQPYLDCGYKCMSIGELRTRIEEQARAGVPGMINDKVKEEFALMSINPWNEPLDTFLDFTFNILREDVRGVLGDVLKNYQDTDLYRKSKNIVDRFLDRYEKLQHERCGGLLEIEQAALFTINDEAFEQNRVEALTHLKQARRNKRVAAYLGCNPHKKRDKDPKDLVEKVTDQQLGPDSFEREVEVAAYIRGYYTTAHLRFVDSVCLELNNTLFFQVRKDIDYLLERELGINTGDSEEKCQALLDGSSEMAAHRNSLKKKKGKLQEFTKILDTLRQEHSLGDDTLPGDARSATVDSEGDQNMFV